ncbi:MAG: ferrous iron transport protein A [Firmicutes bacterium]|nr:ferrous iron transport protein A [Dethiobacter sp.]MBS3887990.1 ferrous iron transport protein A [Bacillota bacterium]MBS4055252.1 ferrous iron transport protein A [Thermaerobacter sp.]
MEREVIPLAHLPLGCRGNIVSLQATSKTRRRLQDLGFIPDTAVEVLHKSPAGDPIAYGLRGSVIALRADLACQILIQHTE